MTLFATHYFELTTLPEKMEGVVNVHLDALEHGDTIAFMHSVQDGAASKAMAWRSPHWPACRATSSSAPARSCASWSLSPATPPRAASMPPR